MEAQPVVRVSFNSRVGFLETCAAEPYHSKKSGNEKAWGQTPSLAEARGFLKPRETWRLLRLNRAESPASAKPAGS